MYLDSYPCKLENKDMSHIFSSMPMGIPGNPNEFIPDETLAHLTVKELNKRVSNLARDEVVALKQRRRTLKNRG